VTFVTEPLGDEHDLSRFDSGQASLDTWLRDHARTAEAMRTGRTFVWHSGGGVVIAYYTLAAHLVVRDEVPRGIGRGGPGQIPAILLARLALDRSLHGGGFGGALLADALGRAVEATKTIAARLVVVDAIDDRAAGFYEHFGFQEVPGTRRLVQKVSDIAAAFDAGA
jgi:GNAT superfamily N-acetyltransferase